ncbi:autotransporter outer membrane beta-barrel domain-containing protein [Neorhodopirellula pilleata]|uniref:Autotransporter domain-containing protein n=1 Tax=Neorhodopirellula pilleata TaxID=2714738 RepID=A0A5C5ZQY6_9BACT|nr:autotransporter outer membrane beta-barrel domain-containing protein [Neorhodopirellula pilleata]TWT89211.1 hypothetical protein Pla100_56790 [Neorhodopirellula pilleata]
MKLSRSKKRWQLWLALGLLTPSLSFWKSSSAHADVFVVTNTAGIGAGSLNQAIADLNAAGAGSHTINFDNGLGSITLTEDLPMILGTGQTVTINGAGNTIDGGTNHRLFFIADGTVTIENITLKDGKADGGDGGDGAGGGGGGAGAGGGLFVNSGAVVTIQGVTLTGNSAEGGAGGAATAAQGGGGGGGFGGNGGSSLNSSDVAGGAGGGGWGGDGGDVASGKEGGGGGGGLIGEGGIANGTAGATGGGFSDGGDSSSAANDQTDGVDGSTGLGGQGGGASNSGDAGSGGDGGLYGGGGGGGRMSPDGTVGDSGSGGDGGNFGGGGGGAGDGDPNSGTGGNAGDFGGGGAAGTSRDGTTASSGIGGFMGGGAGAASGGTAGTGGFGAGDGGDDGQTGDGGDALGGAIFVRSGGSLTIINSDISGGSLTAGAGTGTGSTSGTGMYLHDGIDLNISVTIGQTQTISDVISDDLNTDQDSLAGGLNITGPGILNLTAANTYSGGTTLQDAHIGVNNAASLGTGSVTSNGISSINKQTASDLTLSNDMNWNGLVIIDGQTDGTMTFDGDINLQTGTLLNLQRDLTITSAINASDPTTLLSLGVNPGAQLELLGGSNRTGRTDFFGLNVRIAQADAFGSGLIQMNGDNTLAVNSALTLNNAVNLGNSLTFDALLTNVATLSGPITLTQAQTMLTGQANLTGNIGESGIGNSLIFADDSNFSLDGNNTYTGGTQVGENVNLSVGHQNAFGTGMVSFGLGTSNLTSSANGLTIANDIVIGDLNQIFIGNLPKLIIFDATNLTLSGSIQGPGSVEFNNSVATLSGTNTHMGETTFRNGIYGVASDASLGAGNNQVNVADAALIFLASTESDRLYELSGNVLFQAAAGAEVTLNGTVRSESGLTIGGEGTINFTGLTGFASLAVNDGVLRVNDELDVGGGLTIGTNGTLGGSGNIDGDINNSGTLAVGNSIGDLSQTGNYTQTGGNVEVEIAPGGNTAGTHNDILRVDGNVTINGANLDVIAVDGTYTNGTQYTIFTSTGTTGGTGFTTITDNLAAYNFTTIFGANSILLQINQVQTQFGMLPGTINTRRVATFLDDNLFDLSTTNRNDLLNFNTTATAAEQLELLTQVGGAIYASSVTLAVQQTGLAAQTLSNQLVSLDQTSPACGGGSVGGGWVGWVAGFGIGGATQNDGNNGGLDYSLGGTSFGFGKNIAGTGTFGFFGNATDVNLRDAYAASSVEQSSTILGGFARLCGGSGTYLLMAAAGGFDDIDANRAITGINQTTTGEADAGRALVYLENGFDFGGGSSLLQPYYGLQYVHVGLDAFGETGDMGLDVAQADHDSLRTLLGIRFGQSDLAIGGVGLNYALRAAFLYELADQSADMVASLDGPAQSFVQTGLETGRSFGTFGTQVGINWTRSTRLVANYDLQASKNQVLHLGGGGIELAW